MERVLYELSPVPAVRMAPDVYIVTRKLLDGLRRYAELWPGPVRAILPPAERLPSALDPVEVRLRDLPFQLRTIPFDAPELREALRDAALVHWGPQHQLHDLADLLHAAGTPSVYCTEYSLETRQRIIAAAVANPLRRVRKRFWERGQERRIRRSIARVSGFEANGTPTFEAYRELNPRHLLFFDSRTTGELLISSEALERRLERAVDPRHPLHFVFSGRLIEMKGALDLVEVAQRLRARGVPFRMSICGAGPLEGAMRSRVAREELEGRVNFRGVLPFAEKLMPFLKEEADVFVCCHGQGDPSCTYMETFACGVPIAGYLNEAFAGILRRVNAGWGTPLGDTKALASLLAHLHGRREELIARSRAARAFAADHTFERTFASRVAFFRSCAERAVAA
jgi:colanic acid/amylovoran biosynthesis glycosyltransferase